LPTFVRSRKEHRKRMARTGRILDQKNQHDNRLEQGREGVPRIQLPQEPFGQPLCVLVIVETSGRLELILDVVWLLNGGLRVDFCHSPITIGFCSSSHDRRIFSVGSGGCLSNVRIQTDTMAMLRASSYSQRIPQVTRYTSKPKEPDNRQPGIEISLETCRPSHRVGDSSLFLYPVGGILKEPWATRA
jgi:hypothetical protein